MTKVVRYIGDDLVVVEEWLNTTKIDLLSNQQHLIEHEDFIVELPDDSPVEPMIWFYDPETEDFKMKNAEILRGQGIINGDATNDIAIAIRKRNDLLTECDWVVLRAFEKNESVPQEWADYRQALRDITSVYTDPADIVWPTPPEQNNSLIQYMEFINRSME